MTKDEAEQILKVTPEQQDFFKPDTDHTIGWDMGIPSGSVGGCIHDDPRWEEKIVGQWLERVDNACMKDFKEPELYSETAKQEWRMRFDAITGLHYERVNIIPGEVVCGNEFCKLSMQPPYAYLISIGKALFSDEESFVYKGALDRKDKICYLCGCDELIPVTEQLRSTRQIPDIEVEELNEEEEVVQKQKPTVNIIPAKAFPSGMYGIPQPSPPINARKAQIEREIREFKQAKQNWTIATGHAQNDIEKDFAKREYEHCHKRIQELMEELENIK